MITCSDISKIYSMKNTTINAIDQVSLTINAGEFVALRGPSGCGKSSLLLTIGGMIKPTSGTVTVNEQNIYNINGKERAKFRGKNIGFIFQAFHLIPYLNVLDNILVADIHNAKNSKENAEKLIDEFHLSLRKYHKPNELSTGEKQRVALARAFLNSPPIILADEPTGNLDPENSTIVLNHLKQYQNSGGTIILVTHQNNHEGYTNRTILMEHGKIKN